MIRLGLSLAFRGGRESAVRLVLVAFGVALGVCMLAFALAGFNGLHAQDARWSWLATGAKNRRPSVETSSSNPLYWNHSQDRFVDREIERVDVAGTGARSPVPPGISRLPSKGEMYVSPALARLLGRTQPSQLKDRFPARVAGTIGDEGLTSPDSLIAIVGRDARDLARTPGTELVDSIETASRRRGYTSFFRVILGIGAIGLLFPVLVFIGTTTRLSAARREQRFAAMRLVGATPRQVNMIAATEAAVAALAGTTIGFAMFWALRPLVAKFPFTGEPFFAADLSLGPIGIVGILFGVPLCAAAAAFVSLRKVRVSPLGVSRAVSQRPPRAFRLIPLALGLGCLALLKFAPAGDTAGTVMLLCGFALSMVGLVIAGPWLTLTGTRLLASRAGRATTLIASRRLADDPKRAFRSISGLIIAVFAVSVFTGVVVTVVTKSGMKRDVRFPRRTIVCTFNSQTVPGLPPGRNASLIREVEAIPGTKLLVPYYTAPEGLLEQNGFKTARGERSYEVKGLFNCADVKKLPALGECPPSARVVAIPVEPAISGMSFGQEKPEAVSVAPESLASLSLQGFIITTDGTPGTVERVRTAVQVALPHSVNKTRTAGELTAENLRSISLMQKMAFLGIMVSLLIAGCSLAVSVAGGLIERKRPFSLLRVSGMPMKSLQRVVMLEAAVPLTVVTVISAALGFLAADLVMRALLRAGSATSTSTMSGGICAPGIAYYAVIVAGLAVALLLVISTLPLLRRLTEPGNARFE